MSTFAVFGMTLDHARTEARKKTSAVYVDRTGGGAQIRQLPESEWLEKVEKHALKTFEGTREVQLCKPFDAPQFAEEFIALLRKRGDCRNLHIRARAPAKDASGNPIRNKKTGAPKLEWRDWTAEEKRKVG